MNQRRACTLGIRRFSTLALALLAWAAAPRGMALAAPVRSPGELSEAHAGLACTECHAKPASGKIEPKLCLTCHGEIARTITDRHGLHGAGPAAGKECTSCHSEHLGKATDISGWRMVGGRNNFDHGRTGFPLTGKHRFCAVDEPKDGVDSNSPCQKPAACESCHHRPNRRGERAFSADRKICATAGCHLDVHADSVGQDCARCHDGGRWRVLRFDHDRNTKFALLGRHKDTADAGRCRTCHSAGPTSPRPQDPLRFKVADSTCYGCHKSDDALNGHQGQKGKDCAGCHLPLKRYFQDARGLPDGHTLGSQPIGDAHDRLACLSCHVGWQRLSGVGSMCISCHQRDDIHHNSLGPQCGDCHTQRTFAGGRFSHERVGCMLRGIHRVLPCADCHKGGNYAGLSPLCVSCHRDDAMRAAATGVYPELHVLQTACTNCHNTTTFRRSSRLGLSGSDSVCQ